MANPTAVFIDTEFTDLVANAQLISVGMATIDGGAFYAESRDWRYEQCSDFVMETVLPLLDGPAYPLAVLGGHAKEWLEALGPSVILISDAVEWDATMVEQMFEETGWPANVQRRLGLLAPNGALGIFFENARNNLLRQMRAHHALDDAMANMQACLQTPSCGPIWKL